MSGREGEEATRYYIIPQVKEHLTKGWDQSAVPFA